MCSLLTDVMHKQQFSFMFHNLPAFGIFCNFVNQNSFEYIQAVSLGSLLYMLLTLSFLPEIDNIRHDPSLLSFNT